MGGGDGTFVRSGWNTQIIDNWYILPLQHHLTNNRNSQPRPTPTILGFLGALIFIIPDRNHPQIPLNTSSTTLRGWNSVRSCWIFQSWNRLRCGDEKVCRFGSNFNLNVVKFQIPLLTRSLRRFFVPFLSQMRHKNWLSQYNEEAIKYFKLKRERKNFI